MGCCCCEPDLATITLTPWNESDEAKLERLEGEAKDRRKEIEGLREKIAEKNRKPEVTLLPGWLKCRVRNVDSFDAAKAATGYDLGRRYNGKEIGEVLLYEIGPREYTVEFKPKLTRGQTLARTWWGTSESAAADAIDAEIKAAQERQREADAKAALPNDSHNHGGGNPEWWAGYRRGRRDAANVVRHTNLAG